MARAPVRRAALTRVFVYVKNPPPIMLERICQPNTRALPQGRLAAKRFRVGNLRFLQLGLCTPSCAGRIGRPTMQAAHIQLANQKVRQMCAAPPSYVSVVKTHNLIPTHTWIMFAIHAYLRVVACGARPAQGRPPYQPHPTRLHDLDE